MLELRPEESFVRIISRSRLIHSMSTSTCELISQISDECLMLTFDFIQDGIHRGKHEKPER